MFIPGLSAGGGTANTAGVSRCIPTQPLWLITTKSQTAIFNPGNEPSFLTPFLYNYVPGSQWRSEYLHIILYTV
jgi:putative alpha-1,2-mannosidase